MDSFEAGRGDAGDRWSTIIKKNADDSVTWALLKNGKIIDGDINTKSLLAWIEVTKAIREIGHYDSVIFADELIHAVICDLGGWIKLCQHTEKEMPFVQRDFERRYQIYCRRRPEILPKHLTGHIAHQNAVNGHEKSIPPAVVFSERKKYIKNKPC